MIYHDSGAEISDCGRYRYRLWRRWGNGCTIGFIMLNPSTADARCDDPTITRCVNFAKSWGYDAIEVCNLFAWRSTKPDELYNTDEPVGTENDDAIDALFNARDQVVAAWGNHGSAIQRAEMIKHRYGGTGKMRALKINKTGQPAHPSRLNRQLKPDIRFPSDAACYTI